MKRVPIVLFFILSIFSSFAFADNNCPDLTALQRAAGYVTWENFLRIMAIGAGVGGIVLIFRGLIVSILKQKWLMEMLAWSVSIGLIVGTQFIRSDYQTWTLLSGALLLMFAAGYAAFIRGAEPNPTQFSGIFVVIWGALALYFHSTEVGFLTIGAVMSFMGFSVVVTPFCYGFGFGDDDSMARGTVSGLLVAAAYTAIQVMKSNLGPFEVFQSGALWLGSFVGFTGLLILSSRWFDSAKHYVPMNFLALVVYVGMASVGMIYGLREITTMSIAFLILFLISKPMEIPTENYVTFGIKLIFIAGVCAGAWQWLHTHQELARQYLMV